MSTGQQIGLIGSSVRVQSLPTASAATFGEGNRFYTLIGQQDGYITGHTYRTVMANDVYSWEDVRNELMLLALVDGTITANSSIEVALSNFNRQPLVDNLLIVYSNASQYALMKVSAVTSTAATLIVKDNSAANIVSTKGDTGAQGPQGIQGPQGPQGIQGEKGDTGAAGVGITNATAGESIVADGKTTTPITLSFSDGTTKEFNVEAQNGTGGTSATVDIVQTTGTSTTAVMSQKAVTDGLNKKANSADLATVATSGNYNDLLNKPTIPTDYVPNTRKVNNKALSSDITLGASDVGALPTAGGSVTGNLTVGGNLTINGTTTTVDSTTLQVKDKLIEVAHGNTEKLTSPAGIVAPKYDGTNSGALVFNGDGIASVGDVVLDASGNIDVTQSNLQPLATCTGLVNDNLVKYDGTNQTLVDTGKKISDFATEAQVNAKQNALTETQLAAVDSGITEAKRTKYDGYEEIINQKASTSDIPTKTSQLTNDSNYATTEQVNAKYTKPESGIPKSDLAEDVKTSLGKADTALQSAPVTSVNGKTGDVTLGAGDVGALPTSTKYVVSVNGESGEVKNIAKTNSANTFTGNQTVTGNGSVTGNLTVGGNLTINGTTTTVDSTTLQVKDKLIEVAHGNTEKLTSPAGIVAPKYDGTNSGALVFDSTGTAYVGDVTLKDGNIDVANSGLQPLATRTGLVDSNLPKWDGTAQTLTDSGIPVAQVPRKDQENTWAHGQNITGATADGYSIKASGHVKGSWLQASAVSNKGANTGKVCVFDDNGWIYYRTPTEILSEAGGAKSTDIPTKTSELTNDSGFITSGGSVKSLMDYGKTSNKIKIGYTGKSLSGDSIKYIAGYTVGDSESVARIKDIDKDAMKAWLGYAAVATSGSYNDLSNQPTFSLSGTTLTITL